MKRLHLLLICVLALCLAAASAWGMVWLYGSRSSVPSGTEAGGLPIGGLPKQEALRLLQAYSDAMDGRVVTLDDTQSPDSSAADKPSSAPGDSPTLPGDASRTKAWTLRKLGFRLQLEQAKAAVKRLGTGTAWQRAKYRYEWQQQLPAKLVSNRAAFDAAIRSQWGFYDKRKPVNAVRTITADDVIVYTPERNALHLNLTLQHQGIEAWAALSQGSLQSPPKASSLKGLKGNALLERLGIPNGVKQPLAAR